MKKMISLAYAVLFVFLLASVSFAWTVEAPIGETTDIKIGFGRTVTVRATGGIFPYSFYGASCMASLEGGEGNYADYTAQDSAGSCSTRFEDLDYNTGYLNFNVTCVCDHCTTSTDSAMSSSGNVSFEELAYDEDDGMEPDDEACC